MADNKDKTQSYSAKDIQVLEGLEPVRKRPGMYIGSTGPEGLHHLIWEVFDNSVTYQTPIVIREDGSIKLTEIGRLLDAYFDSHKNFVEKSHDGKCEILRNGLPIESLSFSNRDLSLSYHKVSSLIRHKVNSDIYRLTLQNGRQVEITPYHSLFTLKKGEVVPVKGSDVVIGSPLIVPKVWPEVERPVKSIDLIDEFLCLDAGKTAKINIYGLTQLLSDDTNLASKIKSQIPQWTKSRHRANIWQDYMRYEYLPFSYIRFLLPEDLEKIKSVYPKLGNKNNSGWKIPFKIPVTRELLELLGIFAAEGSVSISNKKNGSCRITFSFGAHEQEFINYARHLLEFVFQCEIEESYAHETARVLVINSSTLGLIFRNVIGTGMNSGSKKVPDLVFNVDSEFRTRFVIGYMSGDGYPTKGWIQHLIVGTLPSEENREKFTAVSKSKEMISGLAYLLSTLDKTYSYGERKRPAKQRFLTVNYKGRTRRTELHPQEISYSLDFYWNTDSSYINYLPVQEIIEKISYKRPYAFSVSSLGIENGKALRLYNEGRLTINTAALKFISSDLGVLRVKKIEKIIYDHPWVYDLSVPDGENFIGGFSPVCFHNSLDEAMAGHAKNIEVALLPDNKVRVMDDGRGIPTDPHPKLKKSALELAATTLHAGGKFDSGAYKVSGGLHGVGLSVVNALSTWMRAEVNRKPDIFAQEYKIGKPLGPVKKIGKTNKTGTTITFQPDPSIFATIDFDLTTILNHLRQQAYLTKGIKITVKDERSPISYHSKHSNKDITESANYTFYFEGGIVSYVDFLNHSEESKNKNIFYVGKEQQGIFVEVALQYVEELTSRELSFANNIHTIEGGMHLTGFRSAITRTLNDYARKNTFLKEKEDNLSGEDVREGLTAIISVKLKDPQFEGQTKAKLGTPDARTAVETVINTEFADWLERNPQDARAILEKVVLASKARLAAKAARDTVLRKGALDGMTLPGKLADCSSRDASISELFLVEGDSAGGCFAGDTKVALTDGRNLSFKELVKENKKGIKNYTYTIKDDGNVGIAPILNPRITHRSTTVTKLTLDNKEEIICTPSHLFMMRDGSYKRAEELSREDSLMPLYRKISKMGSGITISGYEMVLNPKEQYWRFTHVLSDKYNLEQGIYSGNIGDIRHHKDFNKLNNNPDNIVRMEKNSHLLYHTKHLFKTAFRPDVLEKLKKIKQSKEYREKISRTMQLPEMRAMLSPRAKKQWENEEYKKYMMQKFLEFYESNAEYRVKNTRLLNEAQKLYWAKPENRHKQSSKVTEFFEKNRGKRDLLSALAKTQWQNDKLLAWRKETTKKQWTADFRKKRKEAYNSTYRDRALRLMRGIFERGQSVSEEVYMKERLVIKDKSLLRFDTICQRFFDGNKNAMLEAVKRYNHKVISVERVAGGIDVYDIEISTTHNFALASGVFVHNSSKSARDRRTQAILPLRGKILNVEKARIDKMLVSEQIRNLIIAMGTAIAEEFDLTKLRYHKIVIMTDADVDGAHIRTLLLTLFYRYFPKVIEGGYLYIAQPPLYKIQKGSKQWYAYNDKEKDKLIENIKKDISITSKDQAKNGKPQKGDKAIKGEWEVTSLDGGNGDVEETPVEEKISGVSLQRYKGLGEMNPDQLWETTLNPANRVLLQVTIDDAQEADKIFDVLMGSEVMPRRKFIQTHAKSVVNLDI